MNLSRIFWLEFWLFCAVNFYMFYIWEFAFTLKFSHLFPDGFEVGAYIALHFTFSWLLVLLFTFLLDVNCIHYMMCGVGFLLNFHRAVYLRNFSTFAVFVKLSPVLLHLCFFLSVYIPFDFHENDRLGFLNFGFFGFIFLCILMWFSSCLYFLVSSQCFFLWCFLILGGSDNWHRYFSALYSI